MKKHDAFFALSAIFLVLSIFSQTYSIIQVRFEYIPVGIFTSFLSWVFLIRAKKAMQREYQELEEIISMKKSEVKE